MNRVAIVTGSGRGSGKGYARALADQGHRVVIADLQEDSAKQTADKPAETGANAPLADDDQTVVW